MRLSVSHRTKYVYSMPVAQSQHLVHLAPRAHPRQSVEAHALLISPAPAARRDFTDYFGNPASVVVLNSDHETITFHSQITVVVAPQPAIDLAASAPWPGVVAGLDTPDGAHDRAVAQYRVPTRLTLPSDAIETFARRFLVADTPLLVAAMAMTHAIYDEFFYDPKATDIATPLDDILRIRRGVCQDFAHLMIAAFRAVGLPARYVSGYLLTYPPPGGVKLIGADASHAWVAVWCPRFGWVDFDPTNDLMPGEKHVSIAFGRDFQDVSPISGILLGGGDHDVEVGVDVNPVG